MTPTPEISSFEELKLSNTLLKNLDTLGYETPSPIQAESIPALLEGHDLLGQAQTGTGKTAAFALPSLDRLELSLLKPQVLVLTPTRELALQVADAFQVYARGMKGFHVLPVYGGQGMQVQLRQLKRGVHIIVGTPGRVMDHLRRKSLVLDSLKTLVLDEADEMLQMGFIEDVEWILEHTPEERQIALFSATMPKVIMDVAKRHLKKPVHVKIKSATQTVSTIEQTYWPVGGVHKLDALTRILEAEEFNAVIIFVRTRTATVELSEKLEARGYACAALNGEISQNLRERTIENLKNNKLDIIVATDVAARGLDVKRITHVINYDIPQDTESYVHRIGRTGRAGATGKAILFATSRETRMLRAIERATNQKITRMKLPSREDVSDLRIEQFKKQIVETIDSEDLEVFREVVEELSRERDIALDRIAAALAYQYQKERPFQAEDLREAKTQKPQRENKKGKKQRDYEHNSGNFTTYRIEVGKEHGANPKEIVGAIANEAKISGSQIGAIDIYKLHTAVELDNNISKAAFEKIKKVRVRGRKLEISSFDPVERDREKKMKKKK